MICRSIGLISVVSKDKQVERIFDMSTIVKAIVSLVAAFILAIALGFAIAAGSVPMLEGVGFLACLAVAAGAAATDINRILDNAGLL